MHLKQRLILVGALLAAGCNRTVPPPPASPPSPFRPVADVKQVMASVIEPAADKYWDAVGTIVDAKGVVEIAPKTDDEWKAVRDSAFVFTEGGNLLMMSGRAKDNGDWIKFAQGLVEVGQRAIKAAESKNRKAVFDAGAELYDACVNCHSKYIVQGTTPPSPKRPGG
jgi:hypothetical protein